MTRVVKALTGRIDRNVAPNSKSGECYEHQQTGVRILDTNKHAKHARDERSTKERHPTT